MTVGLWQPGVQEPILPYGFGGHTPRVMSAVFDPSGRYVLTAATDGTVRRLRAPCVATWKTCSRSRTRSSPRVVAS